MTQRLGDASSLTTLEESQLESGDAPLLSNMAESTTWGDRLAFTEESETQIFSNRSNTYRRHTMLSETEYSGVNVAVDEKASFDSDGPIMPISPNSWSTSADAPLLANQEDGSSNEDEKADGSAADSSTPPAPGKSNAEYKVAFSHFVRIFTYSTWGDRCLLLAATISSVCTGVMLPLMNVVFGQLVGAFSDFYGSEGGESVEIFTRAINQNVLYIVYLFLGRLVLDYIAILGFRMVSIRISAAIRLAYLNALFSQPISVLDTLPPGQTAAIITVTANILQIGISERVSMFFQGTSTVITASIIAFRYSWQLTLVTSSGLIFIIAFYAFTLPRLVRLLNDVEDADRMSSSVASEAFTSIRMIAACGAEEKMTEKYAEWVRESRRRGLLMSPLVAVQQAPVFFAIHATFALSFWYAVKLYLDEEISTVTSMIIVLTSIMTVVMSIGSVSAPISGAAQAAGAAGVFFSIIDAPQPRTHGLRAPQISCNNDIVLKNVNFAYPVRADVKVLDDLSITFPAGKQTAIVGTSGSGKSTIVGLIERWYELDGNMTDNMLTLFFRSGTIAVGDTNLHEIDLKWWRSQIGLVQQEPFLFNDTIFKNVAHGLVGTQWEYESRQTKKRLVKQACKEAFADEFINRLPDDYETVVGDAGIKLSGGQRQRIAIARSIIKKPSILILDEATSAIDVHGEKIVQAALDRVSKDRTTIVIAHRLSTIVKADNIVVLQKGKTIQQGTHESLLQDREGPYWALVNAQQLDVEHDRPVSENQHSLIPEKQEVFSPSVEEFADVDLEVHSRQNRGPRRPNSSLAIFQLFSWEQLHQWRWYSLMLLGSLGAGAAFPIHSFLFAKLISVFNLWGTELQEQTNFWCSLFALLAIGVGISYFSLGWSSNTISFNITSTYRQQYFQNLLSKPISFHDSSDNSVGSLTARVATDPTQLQQLLGINMAIVLISIFNILGCVAISFYFGWKLTLVTICTALPIILAAGFFRLRYETQFEKMNHEVFAESSTWATEAIGAFRTVTSLTMESEICGRYAALLDEHAKKAFEKAKVSTLVFAISDSISLLCMAFVLWYGGRLLASHEYSPFNYLVIYLAIMQGSTSAGQSLSFGPNIAQAIAAANRIRDMRPEINDDEEDGLMDLDEIESNEKETGVKIELRNVSFKYPTRDVPVLRGLDMTIERGQFAAIVGPSGCGKTSIISLLERFYEPQAGQILYNNTDITNISLPSYRGTLSLVSQEPSLLSSTIKSNILLGVPSTNSLPTDAIDSACHSASIHDFISSLPEGYSTPIGTNGISLSGGQKQRIAIARALVRDPKLLLLDEATSNLDSETEREVQAVFERERGTRTVVVVAHRLATVQKADVIFVMGEGRVIEKGNHEELLRRRGLYWQMCQAQALDR